MTPLGSSWNPVLHLLVTVQLLLLASILQPGLTVDLDDDAPRISDAPRDQKVVDGGIVSLVCRATGNPLPEIYWRRAGRRLTSGRQRYTIVDVPHGSVLRIEPVKSRRDDGVVECVADNGVGEPASAGATIDIYSEGIVPVGYPRIVESPTLKAVEKDRNTVMMCSATGNPEPTVYWFKDFMPVDVSDPRLKILPTGSLQIKNSLESDEGKYECVAENNLGVAYSYGANLYVRVRRVPPHFSIPPENVEVMPGGAVNLTCVAVGSPMPAIKWRLGSVELTPEDGAPLGKNILMLMNVKESATYTCIATSDLGNIEYEAEVRVKALPKPPTGLIVSNVTANTIRLNWNSGNVDTVSSYVIRYRPKFGAPQFIGNGGDTFNEISDITQSLYDIGGLIPHTVYELQVIGVNNIGRGLPSPMVEATTRELAPGSAPQNIRARPLSSSTVVVQWEEPRIPNGLVQGYKVFYTLSPDLPINLWTVHPVENSMLTTMSNLLTNRTYWVRILAYTSAGDGPLSDVLSVKTQQGVLYHEGVFDVPEQPTNLQGEARSPNSIQLTWDAPEMTSDGSIDSYELYYNDSHFRQNVRVTVTPARNTHLLEDLTPNTIYHIRVAAKSARGEGPSTPVIQVRTWDYVPRQSPQNVSARVLNSTAVEVTWNESDDKNVVGYRVFYSPALPAGVHRDIVDNTMVTNVSRNVGRFVISSLQPFTSYEVSVAAMSSSGSGPFTDPVGVRTEEDVPGEPRKFKVEVLNSTAANVQWRPPADRDQNGIVRGYKVHFVPVNDVDEPTDTTGIVDVPDPSRTETIVTGLQPETTYQFQISAYTRKGDGERTRPRKVKTRGAVPSAPRGLQLSLTQNDPPIVSVTWSAPRQTYGDIDGYKLTYGVRGDTSIEERRFDADKSRFSTGFLERGADYEFRLSAKNSIDYGEVATQTIRTPDGIPNGAPQNFTAIGVSPTSLRLQWDPPGKKHRNGEIVMYEILYHQRTNPLEDYTTNSSEVTTMVDGLLVNTDYIFQLRAYTSKGSGPWSNKLPFRTFGSYGLPAPTNVQLRRTSSTAFEASWDAPSYHGVSGYRIYYHTAADPDMSKWQSQETGPYTVTEISSLEPHTVYAVRVCAKGSDGRYGNLSEVIVLNRMENEDPNAVQMFEARIQNPRSVVLAWRPPRTPGVLKYKVDYVGIKKYHNPVLGIEETMVDPHRVQMVAKEERNLYINSLMPNTVYSFNISAKFLDGSWGPPYGIQVETSSDAPPDIEPPSALQSVADGTVLLRLLPALDISVTHYYIVVVPDEIARRKNPTDFQLDELRPDSGDSSRLTPWVAARFEATTFPAEFRLGDGNRQIIGSYFNRPLSQAQSYRVFVRGVAAGNRQLSSPFSDPLTIPAQLSTRDAVVDVLVADSNRSGIELLWIVAPVCAAVVFILVLALIIVVARKRNATLKHVPTAMEPTKVALVPIGNAHSSDPVELRRLQFQTPAMMSHPPIPIRDFAAHAARLRSGDGSVFSQEYESIEPGQQFTWEASSAEINKSKNRYANVIAYDHSRVQLQPIDGTPGSDYINANFMDGYRRPNAYIATQGPLVETIADFWRMIWEQHCPAIVMMTKLEERNRCKCDQYWPSRGTESYGFVHVTLLEIVELATYTVRTFQISRDGYYDKREVRQFQFTAWPDHGVPDHPTPLLLFMRRVKFMTPPDCGPLVVHCSAGVGRTGTFIVIDATLERIKHVNTIDIYGHVTCLRSQRNYMVQTEDQYVFIHDAILEAVQSGNTEILARNLGTHIQKLSQRLPDGASGMELEFRRLANAKPSTERFISANLPSNKLKNRLANILPYESTRVFLQPIRGVEGSDYINANFIDGYRFRRAYIATQGPMPDTTEDFWRMMWEHNCNIIVMLTKLKEMGRDKCHQYWPSERSARYQYFVVDPLAEYNMPQYVLREFKVTDARDGQSRTIRQFQFIDWPEQGVPQSGEGFIELIGQVHKTKEQFGQEGPITVHCSAGVGRTGVFVALSIVLERMRFEGVIDMFQTVNMLRMQRPAMIQSEDQYAFCYNAALEYLGSFDHYTN